MTTEAHFLAAIRAEPRDNLPRLAFADWLDEHGQPERAEVIRVQCEVARLEARIRFGFGHPDWPAAWRALADRQSRLFLDATWAPEFGPVLIAPWPGYHDTDPVAAAVFVRGFAAAVTCPAEVWLEHGDAIAARHPVERVAITTDPLPLLGFPADWGIRDAFPAVVAGRELFVVVDPEEIGRQTVAGVLSARWPGISFALTRLPGD